MVWTKSCTEIDNVPKCCDCRRWGCRSECLRP